MAGESSRIEVFDLGKVAALLHGGRKKTGNSNASLQYPRAGRRRQSAAQDVFKRLLR
jgi:hypothetical protein